MNNNDDFLELQIALDWWNSLEVENLKDSSNSLIGYVEKYYSEKTDIYHLTNDEILYIWKQKNKFRQNINNV